MLAAQQSHLTKLCTLLVVLFFATLLIGSRGYQYAASVLLILGVITFPWHIKQVPLRNNRAMQWFIFCIVFYFGTFVLSMLVHHDKMKELDAVSRALLCIPLVYLLIRCKLTLNAVLYAIIAGSIIAGVIAISDIFLFSEHAAFSQMMQIQGGGIAMSLGIFSLCIGLYYLQKNNRNLAFISFVASLSGILASILSTSRGAWIGLPVVLVVILIYYRRQISSRFYFGLGAALLLTVISVVSIPQFRVLERLETAKNDIQFYVEQGNGSTSVGARFDMWKGALLAIQEKPVLGWGKEGANKKRLQQAQEGIISEYAGHFNQPHNQYLEATVVRGVIGLIGLLGIFIIPGLLFLSKHRSINTPEIKLISLLGIVHILEVMSYCLPQGFFVHQSGTIFYFVTLSILFSLYMLHTRSPQARNASCKL